MKINELLTAIKTTQVNVSNMNLSKRKQTQEHVLYHSTYINAKGWQNHSVMIEISTVVALGKKSGQ